MPTVSDDAKQRLHELPDDVPWLRTSERSAFKSCPKRWWWEYREGLTHSESETPNALWFGIGIHDALAHYYGPGRTRRKDFIERWDAYAADSMRHIATSTDGYWDEKEWQDAAALGHAMLKGYRQHWRGDRDWDVIYTEEPFAIEIPKVNDSNETQVIFISTFDGVYRSRSTKKIFLMEHKTAASIDDGHLALDDQGGAYWALATNVLREKGVLGARERIHGITYNYLRKAMPDGKPRDADGYVTNKPVKQDYLDELVRQGAVQLDSEIYAKTAKLSVAGLAELAAEHDVRVLGARSKIQPKPLFERFDVQRTAGERREQIRRIAQEAEVMAAMKRGDLPIWKTPTRDCRWRCPFYEMCQLDERGQDVTDFKRMAYVVRDPYRDRRKSS